MTLAIDIPARLAEIDRRKLRLDRLAKIRAELVAHDYGAALLSDPMNIRYATDTHTFNVWTLHAPGRYVFVPVDGPVVLFEFGTVHVPRRPTSTASMRSASRRAVVLLPGRSTHEEKAELWSRDIIDLMRQYGGADQRLAVDRCEPWGARHLTDAGIQLFDAQEPLELARMIKTPQEIRPCNCRWTCATSVSTAFVRRCSRGSPRTNCGRCCTRPTSPTTASGSSAAC